MFLFFTTTTLIRIDWKPFFPVNSDGSVAQPKARHVSRRTGRKLNLELGIGARHALYREDGTWYHILERFPGALFDANGYVLFETQDDYRNCPGVAIGKEKNWCHIPAGIVSLPGYVRVR